MTSAQLPNFLLVGAPKSGTTSVAAYLGENPDIYISDEKEPFYLIADIVKNISPKDPMLDSILSRARLTLDDYLDLFSSEKTSKKLRGEATVHYLYHYKTVIPNVKKILGDIPIIILLRNPADRAFSNFSYQSRGQLNTFEEALALEDKRKEAGYNSFWFYKDVGFYSKPVKAYKESFSNVYVCLYEDFETDPIKFMQEIYKFLGAKIDYIPEIENTYNPTIVPKNKLIQAVYYLKHLAKLRLDFIPQNLKQRIRGKLFHKNKQRINPITRKVLMDIYKSDIGELEKIIGRNLKIWTDK